MGEPGAPGSRRKAAQRFMLIRSSGGLKRPLLLAAVACLLLAGMARPAHSQATARIVAGGLQTESFPAIEFSLEAYDSQGNFIKGLTPSDLQLTEDGKPVSSLSLELEEPGLQFSVAINPGAQLGTSIGGKPQLELVRSALIDWVRRQPAESGSDFSLSTNTGLQLIRSREPQQWSTAIAEFNPTLVTGELNLFSLSTAIDLASDQAAGSRMKRAILWVTPPVPAGLAPSLQDLASRAQQAGVKVFLWVAVTDLNASQPDTSAMQALADATGGRFTLIAGQETIPDLESWLQPLRYIYQVKYLSKAQKSGEHRVEVGLKGEDAVAPAQALVYSLEIKPPNPIFLSPPSKLDRTWEVVEGSDEQALAPAAQVLQIMVEFPDGHNRPLTATRLYVDGALQAENTAPPYEQFSWDLTGLTESGTHTLRVEAVDSLGISGTSIETPVDVVVELRPVESLLERISRRGLIAVAAVLVAGAVLAMVLIGENRLRSRRKRNERRRMEDPVTQPVPIPQDGAKAVRSRRAAGEPGSWPRAAAAQQTIPARLIRVTEDEHPVPGSLVPLNRSEITFGSDARQAVIQVEDPSVEKLHARLLRSDDGEFILMDEGSVAGTWVNFTQVGPEGARLKHDDLIHLGRVTFRFELTNPPPLPQPSVQTLDENP